MGENLGFHHKIMKKSFKFIDILSGIILLAFVVTRDFKHLRTSDYIIFLLIILIVVLKFKQYKDYKEKSEEDSKK